jgi:hypothetical protein
MIMFAEAIGFEPGTGEDVRSKDADRDALPVAGGPRPAEVQNA